MTPISLPDGTCSRCHKNATAPGRKTCKACLAEAAEYKRAGASKREEARQNDPDLAPRRTGVGFNAQGFKFGRQTEKVTNGVGRIKTPGLSDLLALIERMYPTPHEAKIASLRLWQRVRHVAAPIDKGGGLYRQPSKAEVEEVERAAEA